MTVDTAPCSVHWTQDQQTGETARALVLEPFATELGLGAEAGAEEAADLRRAGFAVDVLRNNQVTVPMMQQLPRYGVTYIDTHSGTLDNGDAVVVTGETETGPYAPYFRDHTLIQAFVAGDPAKTLYNAVTGSFFVAHAPPFLAGSLLFLNGCTILGATHFWDDLHGRGLSTLISWDAKAQIATNEAAASFVLGKLAQGYSVGPVIADARQEGYGFSLVDGVVARLGYLGAGNETLTDALHGIDPVPDDKLTVTPAPTATPTPTSTPAASTARHRCRPGHHRSHGRCVKTRHHGTKP